MNRPGKGCLSPSRYFPIVSKQRIDREIDRFRIMFKANSKRQIQVEKFLKEKISGKNS